MTDPAPGSVASEQSFAAQVDALAADPARRKELLALLREDHPCFDQRGAASVVRMRGWVLAALARTGVSDDALVFVLEELDTGRDAYLVAAAARALRAYGTPSAAFAPFLMRAFENIRYHDEPVTFEAYGEYATDTTATTAVGEVMATLAWLGSLARGVLAEIEALRALPAVSPRLRAELARTADAIAGAPAEAAAPSCCELPAGIGRALSWLPGRRRDPGVVEAVRFEDQDGTSLRFADVFRGRPTIVAFFYTRCDNPLKCPLTVAKLARVQRMLDEQGFGGRVRTVAITYDPAYDLPGVLRGYGESRALRMDDDHRMLRATEGQDDLRAYFALGVNFIGSLVNRHRVELFVLDAQGRLAASFERVRWDEQQVIDQVATLVRGEHRSSPVRAPLRAAASSGASVLASFGIAFFPKCPMCWAAYASMFGIAGLDRLPFAPWTLPLLFGVLLINVASVWWRSRATGRRLALFLTIAGATVIIGVHTDLVARSAAWAGMALTLAGSVLSARLLPAVQRVKHIRREGEAPA